MESSRPSISFSMAPVPAALGDRRTLPSAARKSDVKLLRSPRRRVFGNQRSVMPADTRWKSLRRVMLNKPRTMTSKKKRKKTQDKWTRIERGCRMAADGHVGTKVETVVFDH